MKYDTFLYRDFPYQTYDIVNISNTFDKITFWTSITIFIRKNPILFKDL